MPASPDPLNYYLGKGIVKWKGTVPIADAGYRDVGNVPLFETTPTVARLPHYSARRGIRFLDKNPVITQAMSLKMHFEEITPENLVLFFMGTNNGGSPVSIDLMNVSEVEGMVRFIGENAIGQKHQVDIPRVTIAPSALFNWIGDTYGVLEITGEVLGDPATGIFGHIYAGTDGTEIS